MTRPEPGEPTERDRDAARRLACGAGWTRVDHEKLISRALAQARAEGAAKTHAPEPGDGTDCWLCLLPKGDPIHQPERKVTLHVHPGSYVRCRCDAPPTEPPDPQEAPMPTDREKGERHEFIGGARYSQSCIYRHDGERTTPKCGQPPDAEVHRVAELKFPEPCPSCGAARWVEDVCACPLPATEKPAEARALDLLREVMKESGHYIAGDILQPESLYFRILEVVNPALIEKSEPSRQQLGIHRASPPPQAQPEETPKRIGGRTREEWRSLQIHWSARADHVTAFTDLLSAAFSRQGKR